MRAARTHPNRDGAASTYRPLIGVSMGDPSGIGAEVIVKALADDEVRQLGRFVIYGIDSVLRHAAEAATIRPFWFSVPADEIGRIDSGVIVADFQDWRAFDWSLARPTEAAGRASFKFFDTAIEAARAQTIDAIVTGPIHKTSWQLAGAHYPGHTERIAEAFDVRRYNMMFSAPGLRVVLASTHIGLFELRNHFNIGMVFQPIDLLHDALRNWFGVGQPRIAVAGLNPHAGEDGLFGDEEHRVIEPAMQMARNLGIHVEGPFPPDTLFITHRKSHFDGIVTLYHDQGLIPVKLLAFDRAVNVTLGLPVIRTSVDHGTAFDIAGRNLADPTSMKEALRLAVDLAMNNREKMQSPHSRVASGV